MESTGCGPARHVGVNEGRRKPITEEAILMTRLTSTARAIRDDVFELTFPLLSALREAKEGLAAVRAARTRAERAVAVVETELGLLNREVETGEYRQRGLPL